jgi:hypothetical protein
MRVIGGINEDGMTFEALLGKGGSTDFIGYLFIMDYMSHKRAPKCAPKTFSWPLVAL